MTHETALGRIRAVLNTHLHAIIAGVITTLTGWVSTATDFVGATATPWLIGSIGVVAASAHHFASWTTHVADGVRTVRGETSRILHSVAAAAPPAVAALALNVDAFLGEWTDPVLGLLAAAHHVAASLSHISHSVPESPLVPAEHARDLAMNAAEQARADTEARMAPVDTTHNPAAMTTKAHGVQVTTGHPDGTVRVHSPLDHPLTPGEADAAAAMISQGAQQARDSMTADVPAEVAGAGGQ